MKNLLWIFIALTLNQSSFAADPNREVLRCLVRSSDFIPVGRMELSRSSDYFSITLSGDVPLDMTRAFKELGLISKFEQLVTFNADWKTSNCKATSLSGWYSCGGNAETGFSAFVARYQDSKGVIHERQFGYPEGFRMSVLGTVHSWNWTFSLDGKSFTARADLEACEYRAH